MKLLMVQYTFKLIKKKQLKERNRTFSVCRLFFPAKLSKFVDANLNYIMKNNFTGRGTAARVWFASVTMCCAVKHPIDS